MAERTDKRTTPVRRDDSGGTTYHGQLPPEGDDLAVSLPESLNVPPRVRLDGTGPLPLPEVHRPAAARPVAARHEPGTSTTSIAIPTPQPVPRPAPEPVTPADESYHRASDGHRAGRPESTAMLTAERLLDEQRAVRPGPEGGWNRFLYAASFHLVNLGDSAKVRARKELTRRIQRTLHGTARFVPVLTRKGGVGKTTVTALLGMALADAREDRVIAIDANPDRGTLSERVPKQTRSTVRDVIAKAPTIGSFTDFSALVSRDLTRLDVLASDTDPTVSEAFNEYDYNVVADLASKYYSIVLTDCGTGIVHSVMRATLQRADSVVIVSGGSVDEARLASETLTWLETNGYGDLVRNSIIALNTATQGTTMVHIDELEAHFLSRVRDVVRIPYDPQLAAGATISYKDLRPLTRHSARILAALVVEGLPEDAE